MADNENKKDVKSLSFADKRKKEKEEREKSKENEEFLKWLFSKEDASKLKKPTTKHLSPTLAFLFNDDEDEKEDEESSDSTSPAGAMTDGLMSWLLEGSDEEPSEDNATKFSRVEKKSVKDILNERKNKDRATKKNIHADVKKSKEKEKDAASMVKSVESSLAAASNLESSDGVINENHARNTAENRNDVASADGIDANKESAKSGIKNANNSIDNSLDNEEGRAHDDESKEKENSSSKDSDLEEKEEMKMDNKGDDGGGSKAKNIESKTSKKPKKDIFSWLMDDDENDESDKNEKEEDDDEDIFSFFNSPNYKDNFFSGEDDEIDQDDNDGDKDGGDKDGGDKDDISKKEMDQEGEKGGKIDNSENQRDDALELGEDHDVVNNDLPESDDVTTNDAKKEGGSSNLSDAFREIIDDANRKIKEMEDRKREEKDKDDVVVNSEIDIKNAENIDDTWDAEEMMNSQETPELKGEIDDSAENDVSDVSRSNARFDLNNDKEANDVHVNAEIQQNLTLDELNKNSEIHDNSLIDDSGSRGDRFMAGSENVEHDYINYRPSTNAENTERKRGRIEYFVVGGIAIAATIVLIMKIFFDKNDSAKIDDNSSKNSQLSIQDPNKNTLTPPQPALSSEKKDVAQDQNDIENLKQSPQSQNYIQDDKESPPSSESQNLNQIRDSSRIEDSTNVSSLSMDRWSEKRSNDAGATSDSNAPPIQVKLPFDGYLLLLDRNWMTQKGEKLLAQNIDNDVMAKLIKKSIEQGSRVINIGRDGGYYALYAAHIVKSSGIVYDFESRADIYNNLKKSIEMNKLENISVYRANFGSAAENCTVNEKSGELFGYSEIDYGSGSDKCYQLDQLFENREVDFIRIQAGVNSGDILLGALKTLENNIKNHIKIVVEWNGAGDRGKGADIHEVFKALKQLGFGMWYGKIGDDGALVDNKLHILSRSSDYISEGGRKILFAYKSSQDQK